MTSLLLILALFSCDGGADVRLGDGVVRPDRDTDTDTEPDDTGAPAYEGDDAGECLDGADNDRDGLYDCDDPDCDGAPDCASADDTGDTDGDTDTDSGAGDDTGDTDVDTDTGSGGDTGDTDTTEECPTTPATEIVGLEASCSGGSWTVNLQFDGEPYDLWIGLQEWEQVSSGGWVYGSSSSHDTRDGSLRLSGTCCESVVDRTFACTDEVDIVVVLLDGAGNTLDFTNVGNWSPTWTGPAPSCP